MEARQTGGRLPPEGQMTRAILAGVLAMTVVSVSPQAQSKTGTVAIYKTPTCGCCSLWVKHLQQNGFTTKVTDMESLEDLKTTNNVPRQARSCHTAVVDGFVIEGHVPAAEIQRLLKERPKGVIGLAVAGMPIGSPGMEVQGVTPQAYNVLAFDKSGQTTIFAKH
jgi:hypothetical protein